MQSVSVWLLFAAFACVIAFLFYRKGKFTIRNLVALPLLTFYLSFVSTITVIARITTAKPQYQLVLFWTYKAIENGRSELRNEIFWNVILFIPIGILISMLLPKNLTWLAFVISIMLSCGIEVTQLLLHRGLFEFDDIIHNTFGAVAGIVLYLLVSTLIKRVSRASSQ